ncbi:MAG: TIGR02186 family protein [Paracoccaceae bacterium]
MIRARHIVLALGLWLAALPAGAEELVAGLSQNYVGINASFDGSEILIFGAVRRDSPPPDAAPLEVVITVSGPLVPVTVRRKERRFGIWVNTDAVVLPGAPSFYAVSTTGPLAEVLSPTADIGHRIGLSQAIRPASAENLPEDTPAFTEALIRLRAQDMLYQVDEGGVILDRDTLFRTSIRLPANLTEGRYSARIFLTRDGAIIDQHETAIDVRKVGLERFLFTLAHEQPLVYALLSLAIAMLAGWGASVAFRYIRA